MKKSIIEVCNVSKNYGGIRAVNNLSFKIGFNSITALIGPNGSGKSTVFNILSGFTRADCGEAFFYGENEKKYEITRLFPFEIFKLGIVRTFQNIRVFPQLTVMENLLLGMKYEKSERLISAVTRSKHINIEERKNREKALEYLNWVGLLDKKDEFARNLSLGQKKLLELTRALVTESQIFLLDEPVAGVFPQFRIKIIELVIKLKENGKTILFIEHDIKTVMQISDQVVVINFGEKIAEGTPNEIIADQNVINVYWGGRGNIND